VQRAGVFGPVVPLDFWPPLNAPRIRAICRAPICRRAFMEPCTPRVLGGRRRAWSPAGRRRLAHPLGEASSNGDRYRGSPGSCTACPMGDASRPGCCHPAVATRSPSSAPFVHTRPARTRQQLVVVRLLPSGNPARFRRTNSRGFDWCASSGHTSSTARKGRSFWRVPSLVFGWPSEGALGAGLRNGFDTIYACGADSVSRPRSDHHALHKVHAVAPYLFID
jgi:hypothetical protein